MHSSLSSRVGIGKLFSMHFSNLKGEITCSLSSWFSNFVTFLQRQDFDWDSKQVGLALSSFFYGYIVTQLLGGWMATRFGGNRVYCAGIAATALLTLITPPATKFSFALFIVIRIVEGLFEVRPP